MVAILNKKFYYLFLCVAFILTSCGDKIEFTKYKSLEQGYWESQKNIAFNFEVTDTILPKNLFINIRNNQKYNFSNLYVITELHFPKGKKVIDTLQYEMADEKGNFLGKGFANIKENKLFYKEKKVFPEPGMYKFQVRHAMRKNGEINTISKLEGIQDVGFSVEKIK